MSIDFPNTPSDGQVYFDNVSGIRYVYDATGGIWLARSNSFYSSVETGQVIFDNADVTGGSNGLYFSTSANTLYANSINVATDMRVRGNLYIGTNTVTITDSAIMAQTFYIMDNGTPVAVPTGTTSNAAYGVANAAFGHTNTTLTHSQAVYAAVNSAFGVVNSAYDLTNSAYTSSNTKVSKSGDTITGTLSIVGDLIVSGNTRQINANTMSVSDPLIYLAANNYASDIVDIGFIANYVNTGGANVHTGLYREHENKEYYLFQGYDKEPINNHIGAMSNNMTLSVLNADIRTSNLNLGGANAITWISSGYGVANAGFGKANTAFQNGAAVFAGSTRFVASNSYFEFAGAYYNSATVGPRPAGDGFSSFTFDPGSGSGSKFDITTTGGLTVYPNTSTGATATTFDRSGNILNQVSVRSPIFYDSDNTGYYIDPASTSNLNGLTVAGTITGSISGTSRGVGTSDPAIGAGGLWVTSASGLNVARNGTAYIALDAGNYSSYALPLAGGTMSGALTISSATHQQLTINSTAGTWQYMGFAQSGTRKGYFGVDASGNHVWGADSGSYYYTTGLYFTIAGSARSPIFYDSDNTGYYVNPDGNTNLNNLIIQGGVASTTATAAYHDAAIEVRELNFGGAQTDSWAYAPRIGFHWGSRVASQIAMGSGGQICILNNPGNAFESFQCGNLWAPIFYDNGNTGYYCDPAATSNINALTVSGTTSGLINSKTTVSVSGTSVSITDIPSGVKRVTVMFNSVVSNSNQYNYLQVGSGSTQTTGYASSANLNGSGQPNITNAFQVMNRYSSSIAFSGIATLTHMGSNVWAMNGVLGDNTNARVNTVAGRVTLSGALDRVVLIDSTGAAFTSGSINVLYE